MVDAKDDTTNSTNQEQSVDSKFSSLSDKIKGSTIDLLAKIVKYFIGKKQYSGKFYKNQDDAEKQQNGYEGSVSFLKKYGKNYALTKVGKAAAISDSGKCSIARTDDNSYSVSLKDKNGKAKEGKVYVNNEVDEKGKPSKTTYDVSMNADRIGFFEASGSLVGSYEGDKKILP